MKKHLLYGTLAALVAATSLPASQAFAQKAATQARPEVSEQAEAYAGDKNLIVTIVRVGKREAKQALVEIVGLDHPWNRRIFKCDVVNAASNNSTAVKNNYEMKVNGKDWLLGTAENNAFTLYLRDNGATGRSISYQLSYSTAIANDTQPEHLLTAYLKQENPDPTK